MLLNNPAHPFGYRVCLVRVIYIHAVRIKQVYMNKMNKVLFSIPALFELINQ